jgi:pimeloyl-ACP methyl ester carboxylesterase
MRSLHCILAAMLLASASPAAAQDAEPKAPGTSRFLVFISGVPMGSEQMSVTRDAQGTTITGSSRIAPPVDTIIRRLEVHYDPQMRPMDFTLQGAVHSQVVTVYVAFADGVANAQVTDGDKTTSRADKISADAVVLSNRAIGTYEALAMRLSSGVQPGATIPAYLELQGEIRIRLDGVTDERIRMPSGLVSAHRYRLVFLNAGQEVAFELWSDAAGRLIRLMVPGQSFEAARDDIASVGARREVLVRPGDERVAIPANGFDLAATISKPPAPSPGPAPPPAAASGRPPAPARLPAVVLVGESGPGDRDGMVAGVPVFAQIAGALADAGFLVVRYDHRGVGQSGGRSESATVADYAEDARAVVKYLWARKDVDRKRIALAGYGEGGWMVLLAGSHDDHVAALVLLDAPGTTGAEFTLEQQERALDRLKVPEADKQAKIDLQKKIQQAAIKGTGWDALPKEVRRQADTPWFQSFLLFDPAAVIKRVKQPVLILQGELDTEVLPRHADLLAALARARKPPAGKAVEVVKLPGLNHLLLPAKTGEVGEYETLKDKTVSPQATGAIAAWLEKTMAAGR